MLTDCFRLDADKEKAREKSWRQAIFNRITNEKKKAAAIELVDLPKKKTKQEIRELWRSAIKQVIMLNKMERENKKLQGKLTTKKHLKPTLKCHFRLIFMARCCLSSQSYSLNVLQ